MRSTLSVLVSTLVLLLSSCASPNRLQVTGPAPRFNQDRAIAAVESYLKATHQLSVGDYELRYSGAGLHSVMISVHPRVTAEQETAKREREEQDRKSGLLRIGGGEPEFLVRLDLNRYAVTQELGFQ